MQRLRNARHEVAGPRSVQFDPRDLPSGVYFYSLLTDRERITRRMVLMR